MSQLSYDFVPAIGAEGELATSQGLVKTSARCNAAVPAGRFVRVAASSVGENPPLVTLPAATGDVTGITGLGFSIADASLESSTGSNFDYASGNVIGVMMEGEMWVKPEQAVTSVPTQVFVRFTVGATADLSVGRVRNDADTDKAVALPGCVFTTICAANGLCKIRYTK